MFKITTQKIAICIFIVLAIIVIGAIIFTIQPTEKKIITTKEEMVTVNIGYKKHIAYIPFFVAIDKGFFEQENLKVNSVVFNSTNQMLGAVVSGDIDASIGGPNLPTIFSIEEKSPDSIKIFSGSKITDNSLLTCVMASQDSELQTLNDLKKSKIGIWPGGFAPLWLEAAINSVGLNMYDITSIVISPNLQLSALASGQIDAIFTLEPMCSSGVNNGSGKIIYHEPMKHFTKIFAASVMSVDFIKKSHGTAEKIVLATNKAIDFIRVNPKESLEIMAQWTEYDKELTRGIKIPIYSKSTEINLTDMQKFADKLYKKENLEKQIDVAKLIYKQ